MACSSVTLDVMTNFLENGSQGPTRPIRLDWNAAFSAHLWNTDAISMIAQACLLDLQNDRVVVDKFSKMTLNLTHDLVQKTVKVKLNAIGRDARRAAEQGLEALARRKEETRTQDRRTTRRNTVRCGLVL